MISGIDNVGIASNDPAALADFYNKIGFQTVFKNERGFTLQTGNAKLFIFKAKSASGTKRTHDVFSNPSGVDHISFLVDDVDATYDKLHSLVKFIFPPTDQEWGARAAGFHDSDGNVIFILKWL